MTAADTFEPTLREVFEVGESPTASNPEPQKFSVRTKPMRTRELMKLLKILTRGAYWLIPTIMDAEKDDVVEHLIAALVVAVPEAEDATIEFVQALVVLDEKTASTEQLADWKATDAALSAYLDNPELGDLLSVVEKVVRAEGEDLSALGNRIAGMLKVAQKSKQLPDEPTKKEQQQEDSGDLLSSMDTSEVST